MINDSGIKVVGLLRRLIVEVRESQSGKLAVGFLPFDRTRFLTELEIVKVEIGTAEPADFPESHPSPSSVLKVD